MKMLHLKIFFLLVLIERNIASPSQLRVVGGQDAEEGQFPYIVSLRITEENFHFCGGSIISSEWVLTAEHCINKPSILDFSEPVKIVAGTIFLSDGGDLYDAIEYKLPNKNENATNDIGLIRTKTAIVFSAFIQPAKLSNTPPFDNSKVYLSGWGLEWFPLRPPPDNLQYILLKTIPLSECKKTLVRVTDDNICTFTEVREGACMGDSGGPLFSLETNELVGVVSWGIPCAIGLPDVFTSVAFHRSWISQITGI